MRGIVGSLVEMLAAIPSVVLGLWGILVLGPFLAQHLEPWLHDTLGFIPLFGAPAATGTGPVHRRADPHDHDRPDHREHLPRALPRRCRASSRRARWRSARRGGRWCAASSCPATRTGIAAAIILGLGRALGEAIAVTQVIGGGTQIGCVNIFGAGDTLASKIAASYQGAGSGLETSSLLYLAAILLVIGLITNLVAQVIVRRFDPLRGAH